MESRRTLGVAFNWPLDEESNQILSECDQQKLTEFEPLQVEGDGNCCYRSVSLMLFGTDDEHIYVRAKTALEMVKHRSSYDEESQEIPGIIDVSRIRTSSYSDLMRNITTLGRYAELTHMDAISAAFGIEIVSYFPPWPSRENQFSLYNKHIMGRGVEYPSTSITLMWSLAEFSENLIWNHIVPLRRKCEASLAMDNQIEQVVLGFYIK